MVRHRPPDFQCFNISHEEEEVGKFVDAEKGQDHFQNSDSFAEFPQTTKIRLHFDVLVTGHY